MTDEQKVQHPSTSVAPSVPDAVREYREFAAHLDPGANFTTTAVAAKADAAIAALLEQLEDALDALDALEGIREAETEGTISLEELRARLGLVTTLPPEE